jgi:hypothetical protein
MSRNSSTMAATTATLAIPPATSAAANAAAAAATTSTSAASSSPGVDPASAGAATEQQEQQLDQEQLPAPPLLPVDVVPADEEELELSQLPAHVTAQLEQQLSCAIRHTTTHAERHNLFKQGLRALLMDTSS